MAQAQVKVEVAEEFFPTKNGGRMQAFYVHLGGRYPELVKMFCREGQPKAPGVYVATQLRKKGFEIALDLENLTPAKG